MLLKIVFFISSHFYAFLSISGGPEARISPRCSIHVICKKEKIKRFFCGFLEKWRKTKEYAADSKTQREYAGLRSSQAPPPGLQPGLHCKTTFCFSASPAGNTVTPNIPQQPASSPPASAGNNLSSTVILFTEQISFFHQSIIFFPARPANTLTSSSFSIQGSSSFPYPTDFIPACPAKPSPGSHLFIPGPQLSISQYTTTADR